MTQANKADALYDQHLAGTMFHGYLRGKPNNDRQPLFERMYLRLLTELATNRFKWINCPPEIPQRFIELNLYRQAFVLFFKDHRIDKYVATLAARQGNIDMYNDPTAWYTASISYPNTYVSAHDEVKIGGTDKPLIGIGVPIWANYLRVPDIDIVTTYAYRLAVLDRTIEINSMNARQNKVVPTNVRQQLTHSNISREIENGNNFIAIKGSMSDLEFMKALDLAIDANLLEALHLLRVKTWSECMGLMGIDNANQEKKERLVEAEVSANDDQSSLMRSVNLNARQEACAKINEIYGLDIWVEYNTEVNKMIGLPEFATRALEAAGYTVQEQTIAGPEGSDDNGELHDAD